MGKSDDQRIGFIEPDCFAYLSKAVGFVMSLINIDLRSNLTILEMEINLSTNFLSRHSRAPARQCGKFTILELVPQV